MSAETANTEPDWRRSIEGRLGRPHRRSAHGTRRLQRGRHRRRRDHRHAGTSEGKRFAAGHFLDDVVSAGTEGCNYLLAVDVDMNTVTGYEMSSVGSAVTATS